MRRLLLAACFTLVFALVLPAAKTLDMWVVDTEGGKAVLMLSPSGQSMLIDTGFPGNNDRDTNRIVEAAAAAGVKKLDILVTTHYDGTTWPTRLRWCRGFPSPLTWITGRCWSRTRACWPL